MDTISVLPQTAEYALRVVVWLAACPEHRASSRELAAATGIPARYLYRVLRMLVRAGLVRSRPGPGGGYVLERPPAEISMLDVIRAVGRLQRISACPLGIGTDAENLCPLHRRLDEAFDAIERAFARTTIAELASRKPPLCQTQHTAELKPFDSGGDNRQRPS